MVAFGGREGSACARRRVTNCAVLPLPQQFGRRRPVLGANGVATGGRAFTARTHLWP